MRFDVVIVGGGIVGLWVLDEVRRRGSRGLLIERDGIGAGQSGWSQGILHSGLKYMLDGRASASAESVGDVVERWRGCFEGRAEPSLPAGCVLSERHVLWSAGGLAGRAGLVGAKLAMRSGPRAVEGEERPRLLRDARGAVFAVAEQVIDVRAVLSALHERNREACVRGDVQGIEYARDGVRVRVVSEGGEAEVWTRRVVLAAGGGNEGLRAKAGLEGDAQQIRPLRMVLMRGEGLPMFFGHCVAGRRTRMTVTSVRDVQGRVVWQVGGDVAERGAGMSETETIEFAQKDLSACLPALDQRGVEWATYEAPRAEGANGGKRPERERVIEEGAVITAWPTKLVLAPRVARRISEFIAPAESGDQTEWPRLQQAELAEMVWDRPGVWTNARV